MWLNDSNQRAIYIDYSLSKKQTHLHSVRSTTEQANISSSGLQQLSDVSYPSWVPTLSTKAEIETESRSSKRSFGTSISSPFGFQSRSTEKSRLTFASKSNLWVTLHYLATLQHRCSPAPRSTAIGTNNAVPAALIASFIPTMDSLRYDLPVCRSGGVLTKRLPEPPSAHFSTCTANNGPKHTNL